MAYDLGDTVPLGVDIVDAVGAPVDASSVTLTITLRGGSVVAGTTPTHPTVGRYEFDFIPATAGLYDVVWSAAAPTTTFDDVVDVRATAGRAISLSDARDYLNKLGGSVDEDELRTMMAAAVERVDRHLFSQAQRDGGRTLATEPVITQSQALAVKMVLAEFWRTQRTRLGGRNVGIGSTGGDSDSGPAGTAPLTVRLTDLLGDPADGGDGTPAPTGSFPEALAWPDPALCW